MINLPEKFSKENNKGVNAPSVIVDLQEDVLEVEETLAVDWAANTGELNIDYASQPGDVILDTIDREIVAHDGAGDAWTPLEPDTWAGQSFKVDTGKWISTVDIRVRNASLSSWNIYIDIHEDSGGTIGSAISSTITVPIAASFDGWKSPDFSSQNLELDINTTYYIVINSNESVEGKVQLRYDDTSPTYADGVMWYKNPSTSGIWTAASGADIIFRVNMLGYYETGYIYTDEMDVGSIPTDGGEWVLSDLQPENSSIIYEAWSSTTGVFGGEEVSIGAIVDGSLITDLKRYYKVKASFISSTGRVQTPTLQSIKASFTQYVTYADNPDAGFETALKSISGLTTTIDTFKASTIGQMTLTFEHSASLSDWLDTKYPKNKDVIVYAGFRATGWTKQDHVQIFHGQISSWKLSKDNLISIIVKDFQKEWSVDVPEKWEGAGDDVTYTAQHHIDVMLNILQNEINVRDSKIDLDSFAIVKAALAGWMVTRTITDEQVSGKKLMEELRVLLSSFFIPNANGSIRIKRFDSTEAAVDSLTDNDFPEVPLWDANVEELKNRTLIYLNWDGDGESPSDFSDVDISADVTSQTNHGEIATHQIKDKWTRTAEKAAQITNGVASDILDRYADPPSVLDVVVDRKKIYLEPGDMVNVTTAHAPSSDGTGIANVKFQIVNKNLDFMKDTIRLKLLEV